MKLLIAVAAIGLATSASAQVQTNCYNNGVNTVCRSYDTGAPQIEGQSSNTITYNGRTSTVRSYQQPTYHAPQSNDVDWSILTNAIPPVTPFVPR